MNESLLHNDWSMLDLMEMPLRAGILGGTERDSVVFGACRSPDWLWGSAVERALVEREWRREAVGDRRGDDSQMGELVTLTTDVTTTSDQRRLCLRSTLQHFEQLQAHLFRLSYIQHTVYYLLCLHFILLYYINNFYLCQFRKIGTPVHEFSLYSLKNTFFN